MPFEYTAEDFQGPEPYEEILAIKTPFEQEIRIKDMEKYAKSFGVNLRRMFRLYCQSLAKESNTIYLESYTNFAGQPFELATGQWRADDWGVSRQGSFGSTEIACCHPIMPVERLVNIDTGVEKLKIAYSKGKKWREIIIDRQTLASANKIVALADMGVAVTSENAKILVRYISDIENANYDAIPERKSVGRLGYIGDEGFSPYVDGLVFDGEGCFSPLYNAVKKRGASKRWKEIAAECRHMSVTARIMLAASFASVLIEPMGALPFFVHLWGGESGTGKTVALMLAASVWGDPELGRYIQTFNSTAVGQEKTAAFLNSLPLLVDELQLAKDARGKLKFNVYELAQGVGRTRGNKAGGIEKTPTWRNCILTTGESPLTSLGDGAGAVNRVIDIECSPSEQVIVDGQRVAGELKKNFGFAGKTFVAQLAKDGVMEGVEKRYKAAFRTLSDGDTTEKQAMAAALIIVADELISAWFFGGDKPLSISDMAEFLQTKTAVSAGERGYVYICEWAAQNARRFNEPEAGELYGEIKDGFVYIIPKVFRAACDDGGFSATALLSFLRSKDLILTSDRGDRKRNTVQRRFGPVPTDCIAIKLPGFDNDEDDYLNI